MEILDFYLPWIDFIKCPPLTYENSGILGKFLSLSPKFYCARVDGVFYLFLNYSTKNFNFSHVFVKECKRFAWRSGLLDRRSPGTIRHFSGNLRPALAAGELIRGTWARRELLGSVAR